MNILCLTCLNLFIHKNDCTARGSFSRKGALMATPPKILMLVENASVPMDNRVWAEALALRDNGYKVSIISPKGPPADHESYINIKGIHIYRYSLPKTINRYSAYLVEYTVALFMTFTLSLKVLFQQGFDVIHAANPPDFLFLIGLFYRPFGKKFVFDQHDLAPEMFQVKFQGRSKLLQKLLLLLERGSYRTAHLVITTNVSQKSFAIKRGHCKSEKVYVVRNGPDLQRIRVVPAEPELKRGYPFLLAYVGEMEYQDGVDNALYALDELVHRRGRNDVALVLMGSGGHISALKALTHQLQLDEHVQFTGWVKVEDMVRYLSVADIGLTPDPANGLNEYCTMVKTMEYMAVGKPVVAFDLAEVRSSAQDAALYATPNLVGEFADNIELLLNDRELRLKMGACGRKYVEGGLNWENDRRNLLLAYESLFPKSRSGF